MSIHLDDDYDEPAPRHTELTLSTGALISTLFGLVLLCALFFWFGYTVRGGPKAAVLPTAPIAEPTSPDATFNSFKPAAGSPLSTNAPTTPSPTTSTAAPIINRPPVPAALPAPSSAKPTPPAATPAPASTPVAPQSANGFYVQVAAISHQQDAEKLAAKLHSEGYLVTARQSPQDSLFHVQIGPYATHKDADLIRQKLATEGYTSIVK